MAFRRQRLFDTNSETVTDAYMYSAIVDARLLKNVIFHIINRATANSLTYKIQSCIDPHAWLDLSGEIPLAAATDAFEFDDGSWAFYRLAVKNTVGASAAIVEAYAGLKS
jgi:hypothetical protein